MTTIGTEFFEMAHGRKPRGTGYWAFDFRVGKDWICEFAPGVLTLAKAKAWARVRAVELGATRIQVGS